MRFLKTALAAGVALAMLAGPVLAQGKPAEIKIGITTFLSGPAAVFGEPGKAAAEMIAEDLNKKGGIGGVPGALSFVDEGAGAVRRWSRTTGDWCRMKRSTRHSPRSPPALAASWCHWPKTSRC